MALTPRAAGVVAVIVIDAAASSLRERFMDRLSWLREGRRDRARANLMAELR
jgi:hypothetical protein